MTYAVVLETGIGGVYEVSCAHCVDPIGKMSGEVIMRAIVRRGPLLCPSCRACHCDYCGVVRKAIIEPAESTGTRMCPVCQSGGVSWVDPAYWGKLKTPRGDVVGNGSPSERAL